MARTYSKRRYRRGSKHGDQQAVLTLVVLLGLALWVHRASLTNTEYWTVVVPSGLGLVALVAVVIKTLVTKINIEHRQRLLGMAGVDNMDGLTFEKFVARMLAKQGYKRIKLTERYDYGVDIIARKDGLVWGIQVKRYHGLVKAATVRQVVTGLKKYGCNKAMVVTNSTFSRVAIELARTNDCRLIDRNELAKWLD